MSARVYVAAPFTEWPLVQTVQAELRRRGATISYDWAAIAEKLPPGTTDADVSEEWALEKAIEEIEAIIESDACLFLTVADKSKGCGQWVELGGAIVARVAGKIQDEYSFGGLTKSILKNLDLRPRIALSGPMRDRPIFSRFGKRFADWRDALPYVLGEVP